RGAHLQHPCARGVQVEERDGPRRSRSDHGAGVQWLFTGDGVLGRALRMISTSDFRNGTMFEMDGQLLEVVSVDHIKLARAGAVIKAKLRNLRTGSIFEQSFRSGDKYRTVRIDKTESTYLYSDGSHHYFMDTRTNNRAPWNKSLLESS